MSQKPQIPYTNIAISKEVHQILVAFIQDRGDGKVGKFTEIAIKEKIQREVIKQAS